MQRCESNSSRFSISLALMLGIGVVLWLTGCDEQRAPLVSRGPSIELTRAQLERTRQLIGDYGCVACHTVPGVKGPASKVGPPLENMALRAYIGGILPNTPDNLARWLLDPPAIDPRTAMPNMGMSDEEAKDIAAYLLSVH